MDRNPPVIIHEPIRIADRGEVVLRIRIEDESEVSIATLYWRRSGARTFTPLPLTGEDGMYVARIRPGADFEYWLEAFDEYGNGPALHGRETSPHKVFVSQSRPPPPADPSIRRAPRDVPAARTRDSMRTGVLPGVATAVPLPSGRAEVRASGDFFTASNFLLPSSRLAGGVGGFQVALGLADWLEVNASTGARLVHMAPRGIESTDGAIVPGQLFSSAGNLVLGIRHVSPEFTGFRFAGEFNLKLPNPIGATGWAPSPELIAATTWSHPIHAGGRSPDAILLHAQVGILWDNSAALLHGRWATLVPLGIGLSRYDWLSLGGAVELPFGAFSAFATYLLGIPFDRAHFAGCDGTGCMPNPPLFPAEAWQLPHSAGVGGRWQATPDLAIDLKAEFSLSRLGRGLDVDGRNAPLEGYAPPAPWTLRAQLLWEFDASPASRWFASILPDSIRNVMEKAKDGGEDRRTATSSESIVEKDDGSSGVGRGDERKASDDGDRDSSGGGPGRGLVAPARAIGDSDGGDVGASSDATSPDDSDADEDRSDGEGERDGSRTSDGLDDSRNPDVSVGSGESTASTESMESDDSGEAEESGEIAKAEESGEIDEAEESGEIDEAAESGEIDQARESGETDEAAESDDVRPLDEQALTDEPIHLHSRARTRHRSISLQREFAPVTFDLSHVTPSAGSDALPAERAPLVDFGSTDRLSLHSRIVSHGEAPPRTVHASTGNATELEHTP